MIASCFILLLVSTVRINAFLNAASSTGIAEIFSRGDLRLTQATAVTAIAGLEFIVQYRDATGRVANGIIINKYYSIAPKDPLSSYEITAPVTGLTVHAACLTPPCTQGSDGEVRLVKDVIPNDLCTTAGALKDCISLVRSCPSFVSTWTLPPFADDSALLAAGTFRLLATTVNLYQYDATSGTLSLAVKNVGELCECMEVNGWEVGYHVCLAYSGTIFAEGTDTTGLIVTSSDNSVVIGFLVAAQPIANSDTHYGEVILHLGHTVYDIWIDTNDDLTAFEYPA